MRMTKAFLSENYHFIINLMLVGNPEERISRDEDQRGLPRYKRKCFYFVATIG